MENDKKTVGSEKRKTVSELRENGIQDIKAALRRNAETVRIKTIYPGSQKYISVILVPRGEIKEQDVFWYDGDEEPEYGESIKYVDEQSMVITDDGNVYYGKETIGFVIDSRHFSSPKMHITKQEFDYLMGWVKMLQNNILNSNVDSDARKRLLEKQKKQRVKVAALREYLNQNQR